MSREEKIGHWAGVIYRQMRWTGEDGADEMDVFDPRLLDKLKSADPEIETLMPSILTYLSRQWLEAPAAFLAKANAGMGTGYDVDEFIATAQFGMRAR